MTNPSAILLKDSFLTQATIDAILGKIHTTSWNFVHSKGLYANETWRVIHLIHESEPTAVLDEFPDIKKMLSFFQCKIRELTLYSLLPGGSLHRHRDLSGTLELGYLRFHVPLITHPSVTFHAAGEDIHMKPGELWAVNTS